MCDPIPYCSNFSNDNFDCMFYCSSKIKNNPCYCNVDQDHTRYIRKSEFILKNTSFNTLKKNKKIISLIQNCFQEKIISNDMLTCHFKKIYVNSKKTFVTGCEGTIDNKWYNLLKSPIKVYSIFDSNSPGLFYTDPFCDSNDSKNSSTKNITEIDLTKNKRLLSNFDKMKPIIDHSEIRTIVILSLLLLQIIILFIFLYFQWNKKRKSKRTYDENQVEYCQNHAHIRIKSNKKNKF